VRVQCLHTHITGHGIASIASIWSTSAPVALPRANGTAWRSRASAPGSR
jgi:hypothetical protein